MPMAYNANRLSIDWMLFVANRNGKLEAQIQALACHNNADDLLAIVRNQYPQHLELVEKLLLLA
jgi:hypothetical protein